MDYTDNYANDGIVRIIGVVVVTIFGAAGLFIAGSTGALAESGIVRINDRGPFVRGRVIDITPAGARALGFSGLAPVKLELAQN
jgi:hypothetical protein